MLFQLQETKTRESLKIGEKKVPIKNALKYLEETNMVLLNSMPLAQANDK